MPYVEGSDQTDDSKNSVFSNKNQPQDEESGEIEAPRTRWTSRITRGQPLERYGKLFTFSALSSNASIQSWYKQTIFIPCYINI